MTSPLLTYIRQQLQSACPPAELQELSLWVAEELTGLTRTELLCGKGKENIPNLEITIRRLLQHEPVQYIFGATEWMGMRLQVSPAVLIPRPETAELAEWILQDNPNTPLRLLDLGTGSGCISIALKRARPLWDITGIDLSTDALSIAKANAQAQQTSIRLMQADILTDQLPACDIIVANPPYICEHEKSDMTPDVLLHEPHTALFVPDTDPLLFYRAIARQHTAQTVYFEINRAYGPDICQMLQQEGYKDIQLRKDMQGNDRMVRAILIQQ